MRGQRRAARQVEVLDSGGRCTRAPGAAKSNRRPQVRRTQDSSLRLPADVTIVAINFGLKPEVEAAGIEPAISSPSSSAAGTAGAAGKWRARKPCKKTELAEDE
jgi:hypothetical protein